VAFGESFVSLAAASPQASVLLLTDNIPVWNVWSDAQEWDGTTGNCGIVSYFLDVFVAFTICPALTTPVTLNSGEGCTPILRRLEGSIKHKCIAAAACMPFLLSCCVDRYRPFGGMFDVKPFTAFCTLFLPEQGFTGSSSGSTCICIGELVWLLERGIILRHERSVRCCHPFPTQRSLPIQHFASATAHGVRAGAVISWPVLQGFICIDFRKHVSRLEVKDVSPDAHTCAVAITLHNASPLQGWVAAVAADAPLVIHLIFPSDASTYRTVTKLAGIVFCLCSVWQHL
jgi:hypothetical protein